MNDRSADGGRKPPPEPESDETAYEGKKHDVDIERPRMKRTVKSNVNPYDWRSEKEENFYPPADRIWK